MHLRRSTNGGTYGDQHFVTDAYHITRSLVPVHEGVDISQLGISFLKSLQKVTVATFGINSQRAESTQLVLRCIGHVR